MDSSFSKVVAVIIDIGVPISHAAIVARKLGIPAVVGCSNATVRVKIGATAKLVRFFLLNVNEINDINLVDHNYI
jgi:phosphoenolpyruvate-protein kinase (PTS system EI component)